jgi:hypothetical protein
MAGKTSGGSVAVNKISGASSGGMGQRSKLAYQRSWPMKPAKESRNGGVAKAIMTKKMAAGYQNGARKMARKGDGGENGGAPSAWRRK